MNNEKNNYSKMQHIVKRLFKYITPYKRKLIIVVILAVLGTSFTIFSPVILGLAVTELYEGMVNGGSNVNMQYILLIVGILAVLYLLSSVFTYIQEYLLIGVSQKVIYTLRNEVNKKLYKLPIAYFDNNSHGDLLSRAINDIEKVNSTFKQIISQFFTSVITLLGITIIMLSISPFITVVVFLIIPGSIFITKKVIKKSQLYFKNEQHILGNLNGFVEETYAGQEAIKSFNLESFSDQSFQKRNNLLYEYGWKAQYISSTITPLLRLLQNMVYIVVCVIGSIFVINQVLTLGNIQAFIMYVRQFQQPINKMATITNTIQSTIAASERIFELLDEEEKPIFSGQATKYNANAFIQFENVSFSYNNIHSTIKDIHLEINKGETVAIIGSNGAGKSTLSLLLLGLLTPSKGKILINGMDIHQMKEHEKLELFGTVLQEDWLFRRSIRENIAYGSNNNQVTDEAIERAAKLAQADYFIRNLPNGYDTVMNESSSNLSEGEKQLIAIARAVLAQPEILVLDEATSHVDKEMDERIQSGLQELMKGRTTFIIAHHPSTLKNADQILVLDKGKIIQEGNREELMDQHDYYEDFLFQS
ncbi:ABC transporter ATP-binding protein [Oceanobacillus iheyensis HTE831]|uniref:ABC transporter ATP-binding protein n=1 Tax=Oceanobacillus iheyensis (strain DSM 14371 / CIP 107618 / JCM 11309 / KCTC 3954 / HTE831) TaxID=221109 RepID=Q8ETK3_OCEIH|nr:ABC transporter ATP-binding protein [Oceanobacillus iheyensis]BAC12213.1 ABC transporter ATP-binding protein [Oceanobacillus iheyensis HTE831]